MHIPASMLNGSICPVTLAVGAAGLGTAAYFAAKSAAKPSAPRFAAVTALVFALQMLNYPVQHGTSGHLVGAALAAGLLGVPFAVLSIALVLAVQAVFFADGGLNALGANVINMAFLGAGLAGLVLSRARSSGLSRPLALAAAACLSVLAGAAACSFEVAFSGTVALGRVLPAMLTVHTLIGLGEALLTVSLVTLLRRSGLLDSGERTFALGAGALALVAALCSPLACSFPDGLEWVADNLSFVRFQSAEFPALFPDYQAPFVADAALSTLTAGLAGVVLVFALAFLVGRAVRRFGLKTA